MVYVVSSLYLDQIEFPRPVFCQHIQTHIVGMDPGDHILRPHFLYRQVVYPCQDPQDVLTGRDISQCYGEEHVA